MPTFENTGGEDFIYQYTDDQGVDAVLIVSPGGVVNVEPDQPLADAAATDPNLKEQA